MAPSLSARRSRRLVLGSSMLIALGPVGPAHAAQLAVAMQSYADPLMANLSIPASAPQTGMWSSLQNWPLTAIHMAMLPSGKIVSYGAPQGKAVQDGRTYDVWDPSQGFGAGHVVLPGVTGVNSFCAAQAFQNDGSLVISGGIFDNNQDKGSVVLNSTATTIAGLGAQLAADRYYGSMIKQADGSLVMLGGDYPYAAGWSNPQNSIDKGWNAGMTPEVYTPAGGWRSLFGANSRTAFGPDNSRYWYPHAWVAPNGKLFGISSDTMWFLDTTGSGTITTMAFKSPPTNIAKRTDPAPNTGPDSTAVLYDRGKILQIGGNSMTNFDGLYYASRAATTIDINGATPVVTDIAPMTYPRSWLNATLLPTGKVVVTGGSSWGDDATSTTNNVTTNESMQAEETWDPATGAWTVGPSAAVYRGYHSTVILLQSGALLSAGGGIPGPVANMNAEVYYPPYLFTTVNGQAQLAPRPQIVSLNSTQLSHGQTMQIEVGSADTIAQVVLIGLSEVTHSFNSGQRRSVLPFTQAGTILSAQLPASTADAPPGYYQLVAINNNGVPSPGAIVALGAQVATPATTSLPVAAMATGTQQAPNSSLRTASSNSWQSIGINAQRIAAASDGTTVTINSNDGSVWLYQNDNQWTQIPGTLTDVAVVKSGSIYGIGTDKSVYRYNGTGFVQVGDTASSIGASADGTIAVVNANTNAVWVKATDDAQINWTQIPNVRMKRIAVMSANSFWGVGLDNGVYRFDAKGNVTQVGRDAAQIAASSDGSIVVSNVNDQGVWVKTGDTAVEAWTAANGTALAVAAPRSGRLIVVGPDHNIYRW